jgi:hypothetical protein
VLITLLGVSQGFSQTTIFDYTGAAETYTVVGATSIQIEAYGANGGNGAGGAGGLGATMIGTFEVTPGDVLDVVVGGAGSQYGNSGGGGAGTGVIFDGTPMIIAGGGGGGATNEAGQGGQITEAGGNSSGAGGTAGMGGQKGYRVGDCGWAGGGGGFIGDGYGGNGVWDGGALPGTPGTLGGAKSWLNGGAGGTNGGCTFTHPNLGAWGCGGGGAGAYGGAGGGGYSGGGGGQYVDVFSRRGGGGGGSFNSGTDQDNTPASHFGNGQIIITVLCTGLTLEATPTGVCAGESVTLTATSLTGGTVTWDMGIINGETFTPPLGETVYTATSTSSDDCELVVTVTSTEVPEITANSSSPVACEGTVITLWGEGGDTYTWDLGVEDSVAFEAPEETTTYTLIGSLLDCAAEPVELTMVVEPQPDIAGVATPAQICLGESFVLTGAGDAATYNWGETIEDGDEVTPATAGTFAYVVIGNSDVGCGDTAMVSVTVFGLPTVNGGSDVAVCEGEEVTLTGSGAPTLEWSPMITDGEPFEAMAGANVYTLTGTDANGCEDTDEVTVTGVEVPVITDAVVTDEYFGYDGSIDITVEGGSGAYTYEWSHGPVSQDVGSLTAGTYTVIVNDITVEKGLCESEGTYEIGSFVGLEDQSLVNLNVYPNPVVDEFTIATEGTFNYDVVNLLGEVILSGQGTTSAKVSMKDFANGTYIVKVKSGEQTGFVQIVKQ